MPLLRKFQESPHEVHTLLRQAIQPHRRVIACQSPEKFTRNPTPSLGMFGLRGLELPGGDLRSCLALVGPVDRLAQPQRAGAGFGLFRLQIQLGVVERTGSGTQARLGGLHGRTRCRNSRIAVERIEQPLLHRGREP